MLIGSTQSGLWRHCQSTIFLLIVRERLKVISPRLDWRPAYNFCCVYFQPSKSCLEPACQRASKQDLRSRALRGGEYLSSHSSRARGSDLSPSRKKWKPFLSSSHHPSSYLFCSRRRRSAAQSCRPLTPQERLDLETTLATASRTFAHQKVMKLKRRYAGLVADESRIRERPQESD
jgi:hypothetical protein